MKEGHIWGTVLGLRARGRVRGTAEARLFKTRAFGMKRPFRGSISVMLFNFSKLLFLIYRMIIMYCLRDCYEDKIM